MWISSVQRSGSGIHMYTFFFIISIMAYHDIEYSSLCYTLGPCPSILHVIVCTCQSQTPTPSLPHPSSFPATTSLLLCLWVCFCFIDRFVCVSLKTCLPFDPTIQLSRRLFWRSNLALTGLSDWTELNLALKGCVNKNFIMFIIAKKTGSGLNIKQ